MTFCGNSKSNDGLTLRNVPWHEEVVHFVQQLEELLDGYEIASEHEHSNCVLLARKQVSHVAALSGSRAFSPVDLSCLLTQRHWQFY